MAFQPIGIAGGGNARAHFNPTRFGVAVGRWLHAHGGDYAIKALSVVSLLGLWYLGAATLPSSVMPAPQHVAVVLWHEVTGRAIWIDVAISLTRIVLAFAVAMALALVLGFAMGLSRVAERFFDVWMVGGISLPSLVIILTIFMIVGLNDRAAILGAALPVVPILTINIWAGIKSIDQKLIDMSKAYHAERSTIILSVVAPQVAPILMASSRFGLGLIWKMVLFVELLGRSDGVGYKIDYYYQMFNMSEVLAHALLFLLIMLFIEFVLIGRIERHLFKWRPVQRRI
ncbi:MAG TPA: ABC transporter permease subunit [Stellaceae bacterium]|jgi:NitT/TauT family transport system permease protein|nr:ABC transporter permease subunit [Stellaceae bacterium]